MVPPWTYVNTSCYCCCCCHCLLCETVCCLLAVADPGQQTASGTLAVFALVSDGGSGEPSLGALQASSDAGSAAGVLDSCAISLADNAAQQPGPSLQSTLSHSSSGSPVLLANSATAGSAGCSSQPYNGLADHVQVAALQDSCGSSGVVTDRGLQSSGYDDSPSCPAVPDAAPLTAPEIIRCPEQAVAAVPPPPPPLLPAVAAALETAAAAATKVRPTAGVFSPRAHWCLVMKELEVVLGLRAEAAATESNTTTDAGGASSVAPGATGSAAVSPRGQECSSELLSCQQEQQQQLAPRQEQPQHQQQQQLQPPCQEHLPGSSPDSLSSLTGSEADNACQPSGCLATAAGCDEDAATQQLGPAAAWDPCTTLDNAPAAVIGTRGEGCCCALSVLHVKSQWAEGGHRVSVFCIRRLAIMVGSLPHSR